MCMEWEIRTVRPEQPWRSSSCWQQVVGLGVLQESCQLPPLVDVLFTQVVQLLTVVLELFQLLLFQLLLFQLFQLLLFQLMLTQKTHKKLVVWFLSSLSFLNWSQRVCTVQLLFGSLGVSGRLVFVFVFVLWFEPLMHTTHAHHSCTPLMYCMYAFLQFKTSRLSSLFPFLHPSRLDPCTCRWLWAVALSFPSNF